MKWWRTVWLLVVGTLLVAGCAAPAARPLPAELPLFADDGEYHARWALVREGERVWAVGVVRASLYTVSSAAVDLYGLDERGRIVSRGSTVVRWGFGPDAPAFEVELRPRGGEASFVLRIRSLTLSGARAGRS